MMYIPIHDMGLSTTVLAENNRITLSRASPMKTLNDLEDIPIRVGGMSSQMVWPILTMKTMQ